MPTKESKNEGRAILENIRNIRNMLQTCSKKCQVVPPLVIKCHQSLHLATPPKSAPPSSLGSMESRPPALHQLGGGGVATAPGRNINGPSWGNNMEIIWELYGNEYGMLFRGNATTISKSLVHGLLLGVQDIPGKSWLLHLSGACLFVQPQL